MPLSMSQLTVPAFVQGLDALAATLGKAQRYATDRKIEEAALLQARLFPDMYPLVRQVQIACDFAKGAVARLSGSENPSYADTETTFEGLQSRIGRTLEFIRSVPADAIDGSEKRIVSLKGGSRTLTFEGDSYLLSFVLPNFYFHLTTAYGILRHNGVELGKMDYAGAIRMV